MTDTPAPDVVVTEARVIYIRWSDDGRFIRKWDTKPFDGAQPMYSRSWLLSEEGVEAAARGLAKHDRIEICQDATYRLSTYGPKAIAAIVAAIGEPYEFSGWVEVVEDGDA